MKRDNVSALISVIIVGSCLALGYYVQNSVEINSPAVSLDYSEASGVIPENFSGMDTTAVTEVIVSADGNQKTSVTALSTGITSGSVSSSVTGTSSVTASAAVTSVLETTVLTTSSDSSETKATEAETEKQSESESRTETQETDPPETEAPQPEPEPPVINTEAPSSASEFQREVYRLVNEIRIQNGLNPLECTELYNSAAQHRAEEQLKSFGHKRPDGSDWDTIFVEYRLSAGAMGENAIAGYESPYDAVMNWMNSDGHRANILNPDYRVTGVGYFYSSDSEFHHYWLQLFG